MCMAFLGLSLSAQKLPKSVKDAKKALNAGSYTDALNIINTALEDGTTANIAEAWAVKGDALNGMVALEESEMMKASLTGGEYTISNVTAGPEALVAYQTALEKAVDDKDKGKKAAVKGLVNMATSLNEIGLQLFNNKRFPEAFNAFNSIIEARKSLFAIGNKSLFSKEEDFNTMQYYTGLAAAYAKTPEKAISIYQSLADINYNKPLPYEQLFEHHLKTDEAAALEVLAKGRKNCADDPKNLVNFLYKEINFYLKKKEYDVLESKLQDAIAQDPDNASLYYALGNVYGELASTATSEGKTADADKYFDEAKKYYEGTLKVKADHHDAAYNIGALYYNKATLLNGPLKDLGSDMSKSGMAKYDEMKEKQKGLLLASVPHFEKALSINDKHLPSMEALKGVAAYNNDNATVSKYEAMIKAL